MKGKIKGAQRVGDKSNSFDDQLRRLGVPGNMTIDVFKVFAKVQGVWFFSHIDLEYCCEACGSSAKRLIDSRNGSSRIL